jgi:hypothetical protein
MALRLLLTGLSQTRLDKAALEVGRGVFLAISIDQYVPDALIRRATSLLQG